MDEGAPPGPGVRAVGRWSRVDVAVGVAVGVCAALLRASTLPGALIWDDQLIVKALAREGGFSLDMLLRPAQGVPGFRARFYHPLQLLLYGAGWTLGGTQPLAYHVLLVAMHALVAAAVTVYAAALFRRTTGAGSAGWWAGLTFAVLPIHTQAVAWIICSVDVLTAVFLLAAALAGLASGSVLCAAGTAAGLFGALCAKETAFAGVLFLPLQAALLSAAGERRRRVTVVSVACAVAVGAYLAARAASGFAIVGALPESEPDTLAGSWWAVPPMIGWYVLRLVFPVESIGELLTVPDSTALVVLGGVAVVLAVALIGAAWRRDDPVALIGWAWVVLFLAPALTPAATVGQPLAIHRLYIPSIGVVLLLANGVGRCVARWNHARVVGAVGAAVLALLAARSWQGSTVWRDEVSFWNALAVMNPGRAFPRTYLGEAYLRAGDVTAAMEAFGSAAEADGSPRDRARPFEMSGAVFQSQGNIDAACDAFDRALTFVPAEVRVRRNAAACRAVQAVNMAGDRTAAAPLLLSARRRLADLLADTPNDAMVHRLLGEVLVATGDLPGGRRHLERALALDPRGDEGRRAAALLQRLPRP